MRYVSCKYTRKSYLNHYKASRRVIRIYDHAIMNYRKKYFFHSFWFFIYFEKSFWLFVLTQQLWKIIFTYLNENFFILQVIPIPCIIKKGFKVCLLEKWHYQEWFRTRKSILTPKYYLCQIKTCLFFENCYRLPFILFQIMQYRLRSRLDVT